jgi:Na+/H+-dicarboxylate symporter
MCKFGGKCVNLIRNIFLQAFKYIIGPISIFSLTLSLEKIKANIDPIESTRDAKLIHPIIKS